MSLLVVSFTLIAIDASALFGIKIKFEKGSKEWNADHTKTECVGKGLCTISIDVDALNVGTLGWGENGRFGLSTSKNILSDRFWSDTFCDGYLTIYKDIILSTDIVSKIKNCPPIIKAGKYKYTIENSELVVYFN